MGLVLVRFGCAILDPVTMTYESTGCSSIPAGGGGASAAGTAAAPLIMQASAANRAERKAIIRSFEIIASLR